MSLMQSLRCSLLCFCGLGSLVSLDAPLSAAKREALELWAGHFPGLCPWDGNMLIRNNGGLISGICLDERRRGYQPKFFFHNLAVPFPDVSLSYAVPLRGRHGIAKEVGFGDSSEACIHDFRAQVPIDVEVTLDFFVRHVAAAWHGEFGPAGQAMLAPNFLRDVITLGFEAESYYLDVVDEVCEALPSLPRTNFHIVGSPEKWKEQLLEVLRSPIEVSVRQNSGELGLPDLPDGGLLVTVIREFWKLFF